MRVRSRLGLRKFIERLANRCRARLLRPDALYYDVRSREFSGITGMAATGRSATAEYERNQFDRRRSQLDLERS